MAVYPELRGQGIGKRMLQSAETLVKQQFQGAEAAALMLLVFKGVKRWRADIFQILTHSILD
jgi:GNAT superfamily N-acetyltransferase